MRYHWGLGVGHVYADRQSDSTIPQNEATETGEHEQENEGEDRYSFSDTSKESSGDEDEGDLDLDLVDDWGADSGSFESIDNDVDDDILDYQN